MGYRTLLGRGALLLCTVALAAGSVGCSDDDEDGGSNGGGTYAREVLDGLSPADLGTADSVSELAGAASAPGVFGIAMVAVMLPQMSEDTACPVRHTEGSVMTFTGGCTDAEGREWLGTVTIEGGVGESVTTFADFGSRGGEECGGVEADGTMIFDGTIALGGSPSALSFEIDLRAEVDQEVGPECERQQGAVAWDYQGTFQPVGADEDGDGDKDDSLWGGSGRIGSTEVGVVEAQTDDELMSDSVCETEAESGVTTLRAGGDTAAITYDGATECDPEATVRWTLNGADKGELQGVSCSAAPGSQGGCASAAGALLLAAALACSRRRR